MKKIIFIILTLPGCSVLESPNKAIIDCEYEKMKLHITNHEFISVCMKHKGFNFTSKEGCYESLELPYCWKRFL